MELGSFLPGDVTQILKEQRCMHVLFHVVLVSRLVF